METKNLEICPACKARPGELHRLGCDVERCPRCGLQLLLCIHYLGGAVRPPPDQERMPWTGEWPGERECREFGWCYKRNPAGPGNVPCAPDDPGALPDLNRLLSEAVWDRGRRRFVRKEDKSKDADAPQ